MGGRPNDARMVCASAGAGCGVSPPRESAARLASDMPNSPACAILCAAHARLARRGRAGARRRSVTEGRGTYGTPSLSCCHPPGISAAGLRCYSTCCTTRVASSTIRAQRAKVAGFPTCIASSRYRARACIGSPNPWTIGRRNGCWRGPRMQVRTITCFCACGRHALPMLT